MNREQLIRQIVERAVVNAREAIENQSLDRELVSRACAMQLAAFKLEPRPVIFYSNLPTAAARVRELAKNSAWRDASLISARERLDIRRGGLYLGGIARVAYHSVCV